MKQLKIIGLPILITFALGLILGIQWESTPKNTDQSKKPLYWIDSMEPTIHYPGPGKSHMGMELTPVYEKDQPEKDNNSIKISASVENNLGVRTALVTQGAISRPIETIGYIEPNENNITHIHPYVDGWIRVLQVKTTGATVKKGDVLFQLYSPSLINAEQEYLQTLQGNDQNLQEAGKGKLLSLGVSEQQIQQITTTRKIDQLITTYSPQDGIVTELNVREGMRVTPDIEVMGLLNLSSVWMAADVFEDEAAWVQVGQTARAKFDSFPGKTWEGQVNYVYPSVDPSTRTVKVRIRLNNAELPLKPNMYASITILTTPQKNALSIPLEAIIPAGTKTRVIVSLGNGRFEPRIVETGIESGDRIEILSGLKADERIVTSGQFMLDSEANLNAGVERLDAKMETKPAQPQSTQRKD